MTMGQSTPYTPEELARLRSGPLGWLRAILDTAIEKRKAEMNKERPAPSPHDPSEMWFLMGPTGEFTMSLLDEDGEPEPSRGYQPWCRFALHDGTGQLGRRFVHFM
jgi:hypothetical protein